MGVIAVAGSNGFVGTALVSALTRSGEQVRPIPRLRLPLCGDWCIESTNWLEERREQLDRLVGLLEGCDAVVNAAGLADAGAQDGAELTTANVAVPMLLLAAAERSGCTRLVQISSASVQGRRDPLDESMTLAPISPYARSKAAAERALSATASRVQVAIYRATSVQATGRAITRRILRYAALPVVPVVRRGDVPVPVALLANAVAAVVHLATSLTPVSGVYLHPWERMTTAALLRSLAPRARVVSIPQSLVRAGLGAGRLVTVRRPSARARLRSVELMMLGQRQHAARLDESGFACPIGPEGYRELGDRCSS